MHHRPNCTIELSEDRIVKIYGCEDAYRSAWNRIGDKE